MAHTRALPSSSSLSPRSSLIGFGTLLAASFVGLITSCEPFHAGLRCIGETTLERCSCTEASGCRCEKISCAGGTCVTFSADAAECTVSKDLWPGCDPARPTETECDDKGSYTCNYGYRLLHQINDRCLGVCVPHDGEAICAASQERWAACDPAVRFQSLCDGETPAACSYGFRLVLPDNTCQAPSHCMSNGVTAGCDDGT